MVAQQWDRLPCLGARCTCDLDLCCLAQLGVLRVALCAAEELIWRQAIQCARRLSTGGTDAELQQPQRGLMSSCLTLILLRVE